jgi:ribonuclease HIII
MVFHWYNGYHCQKGCEMAKKKKDYEAHEAAIQSLREFASRRGWQIVEEREIDYGYRLVVFDGFTRNNVDFYPSGKIVIQGIPGALRDELGRWREERTTAAVLQTGIVSLPFDDMPPIEKPVSVEQAVTVPISKPTARESIVLGVAGREDYFGPLVVSAIRVDAWAEAQFSMLGIQDGALLSDEIILAKAEEIKTICAHSLVTIGPARYNEAFGRVQKQDSVWAWGNVRAIENMLEKATCERVVARQFGDEAIVESALGKKGHQITLEQSTDSQVNIAVAVANILADAEYVRCLDQLAQRVGQKLLRGAVDQAIIQVGREIVAKGGKNALGEVAKLHFELTQKILQ